MSIKKKIFISHNYVDQYKVNLLKGQFSNTTDIDVTFVSEDPDISSTGSDIQKSITNQIEKASMMLVMLGENWSKWQEYEVNSALECRSASKCVHHQRVNNKQS